MLEEAQKENISKEKFLEIAKPVEEYLNAELQVSLTKFYLIRFKPKVQVLSPDDISRRLSPPLFPSFPKP